MENRPVHAYVAEFIGTFALVFFIGTILSVAGGLQTTDWAVIGLVHAFILAMLVYTLGTVSGGHFNPAVTFAAAMIKRIKAPDAVVYIAVQLGGAVLAALLVKALLGTPAEVQKYGSARLNPTFDITTLKGVVIEGIGTFFLMWAIMSLSLAKDGARNWASFLVGTTLGLIVMTAGPLTGGSFNPARWFGPALITEIKLGGGFTDWWVFILGPAVGAVLAAFAYAALVMKKEPVPTSVV